MAGLITRSSGQSTSESCNPEIPQSSNSATVRFVVVGVVLFTVLTAVMTYPQVLHLRDAVHDDGDPLLNAWTLSWVAHQFPRAPAHLFDANIFFPERRTLAYSETLVLPSLVVAPLSWLGAGPLLVYNVVFLSGFVLSGLGVALLVRTLTGNGWAAVVAGFVFAFLPYRIDHYPHLQLQQTQCLPFALWSFHRLLRTGRIRDGVLFGVFTAGQILSCTYYGIFLIPYLTVVCGALVLFNRQWAHSPQLVRRQAAALAIAAALVAAAAYPVGRAYLEARRVVGERGREEVANGSATWRNYLAPAEENALYGEALKGFMQGERRLFPGFVAVILASIALWPPTNATRLAYGLGLLLAFDVSLGFNGLSYRWLYDYFLPFRALRIPARMGIMVGFSLAVLAGFGAARVAEWIHTVAARRVTLVVIGVLMLAEYASKPLDLQQIPVDRPEVYVDLLRDRGDSPTAPIFEYPGSPYDDPTYMYYSTFHWQSLLNGYSGFFPPSYGRLMNAMQAFPDDESMRALEARGARYLVVHGERLFGDRYERLIPLLDERRELRLVSRRPWQHSEMSLYRVVY